MKPRKLVHLFTAARRQRGPAISEDFEASVMRLVRREKKPAPLTLADQLNSLFPWLAWGAAVIICICVATDWLTPQSSLTDGVAQISEQWVFIENGL